MRDFTALRERQQQPLTGNDAAIDVIDVGDGVDRKRALDALVVDRHHDGDEPGGKIFVEKPALAGVSIGARHPRAVALDGQPWRLLYGIDGVEYEVLQFVFEPRRLIFL